MVVRIPMSDDLVLLSIDPRGVATVTLNRPKAKNALSGELMARLREITHNVSNDDAVRAVILTAAGDIFCAGGDLKGMHLQASNTREGREADATEFAATLHDISAMPKLLIGRINGSAFGGGIGLMSLCDVTVGLQSASYRLTEVTLGLIAATISPYVVAKVGVPNARRMMLHALPLDGDQAKDLNLLDVVVDSTDALDAAVEQEIGHVLKCAPGAVAATKQLIRHVSTHSLDESVPYTVQALADAWETDEIREGIDAFLNKRRPNWSIG